MDERRNLDFLGHIRPIHLLTTTGLFLFGTGLSRYLGERVDFVVFSLGLFWLISIQLGFFFLSDFFETPFDIGLYNRLPPETPRKQNKGSNWRDLPLYTSLVLLTTTAVLTIIIGINGSLSISSGLIMVFFFSGFCALVIPGLSLEKTGIGEIVTSIILVLCPPALAFLLQFGEFHPFLVYGVIPIFPLHVAMIIILRLVSYREDLRLMKKNLLVRIGWIRAVFLHNILVFCGFLFYGFGLLFGFPFYIIGNVFIALPAGIYLVWYLSHLENGAPVRWSVIISLSLIIFFLPLYLITYSTWMN